MSSVFYSQGPREIWTSEKGSMAWETARTRWPKIVQGMIDDVRRSIKENSSCCQKDADGHQILNLLLQLKRGIEEDEPLSPLSVDGSAEIDEYNAKLASFGRTSWHDCPWLFAECYLYRRVNTIFARFSGWATYDVFARQKLDAFTASRAGVEELSSRYLTLQESDGLRPADPEAAYLLFVEMTEIALWGNATDLSLLSHLSLEQIHSLQGAEAVKQGQSRIVSNDTRGMWEHCDAHRGRAVDIVLDNAGFELFTDLVYSLYLLGAGLASQVRLHVKSIPWFVSDVTVPDVDVLLVATREAGREATALSRALQEELRNGGRISLHEHRFWTTGFDFHEMPSVAPDLFKALGTSDLVIFKGDLNYRKLVRDAAWPHSTPFKTALGPLASHGDGPSMKIAVLRTNKADVCVGVDESTLARLEKEAPEKAWVRNGKYAVVSFSDGL